MDNFKMYPFLRNERGDLQEDNSDDTDDSDSHIQNEESCNDNTVEQLESLSEEEQSELTQALSDIQELGEDFPVFEGNDPYVFMMQGIELFKMQSKVALAQKLYFKKIAKQLGRQQGLSAEHLESLLEV